MSEWQPIETAPQDETSRLFFGPKRSGGTYIDIGAMYRGRWTVAWMDDQDDPTHWMPLPEPPK